MKILEQINERIDLLQRIEKAKQTIDSFTVINWEKDVEKMDFRSLYGGGGIQKTDTFIRIDTIKIEPNPDKEALFQSVLDSERIVNLIELMASGEKIIPPMYADVYDIKDGEKVINEAMWFFDGAHRKRIAGFLQLSEIPVVVFERVRGYLFSPNKWSFRAKDFREKTPEGNFISGRYLEATSKDGTVIEFKDTQYQPYLPSWNSDDSDGMSFIEIHTY